MISSKLGRKYGWRPELPQPDDLHTHRIFSLAAPVPIPQRLDFRNSPFTPPIYDQGDAGSCTGNGTGGSIQYDRRRQGMPDLEPSRLFLYYNGRIPEGTTNSDAGAQIFDVIAGAQKYGYCPETEWPYNNADVLAKPNAQCYADALPHRAVQCARVLQTQAAICQCLAAGFPIVFGFTVYESFESPQVAQTGIMPLPKPGEQCLGGHCVDLWGYDLQGQYGIVRNSWGSSWGQGGYFLMPLSYLLNPQTASDFWQIQHVT